MKCENKFNNSAKPRSGKDSKCHNTTHRRKIVHPCSSHGDHLRHHIWLICDPKIHLSLDQLRHNLDNVQHRQGFLFRGLAWRDLKGDVVSVCSPVLYRTRGHQRAILVASSTFSTSFHHHHHSFLPSFPYMLWTWLKIARLRVPGVPGFWLGDWEQFQSLQGNSGPTKVVYQANL